jgi:iron complex outermembrane receptor protein
LNDQWSIFLGARVDKTETTNYLFSPRLSLIHTPNDKDTWKLMLGRSQRMTFAEQMRHKWELTDEKSDSEEMDSIEIRYERQHLPNLWFAVSSYYYDLDVIAWDSGTSYSRNSYGGTRDIGDYQCFGLEGEMLYQKDNVKLSLSHGFTKLLNFHNSPGVVNNYSAEPFGYGDDLANWSNHISKIVASYDFDDKLKLDGNAQVYWGFPGAKDYAKYLSDKSSPISRDPGYDTPYGPSVFLNLGLQYQLNENMTLRVDAYDLMGLCNKKYNKTLYGFNSYGDYRSSAPSLAFTLFCKF